MNGWPAVLLGEVADLCLGKMLDAKKNKGDPYPYLSNPDVRWFDVDTSRLKNMLFESRELDRFGLCAGDVLVCEGGEAGRAAVWDGRRSDVKFQKAIHRVRPRPRLLNRFLVHKLFADYHAGRLEDYYTGATIKHLTGQDLATYELALPPIDEQRRIVDVLDRAEALRAKRRAALALLDTLAQSIFIDLFVDPAKNPKGCAVRSVSDLLESATYGTSSKAGDKGDVAVLRMNNITRTGDIDLSQLKYMDLGPAERDRYMVQVGDVLFNRTNSADLVGKTAIVRDPTPMAYAGYLVRLRVNARNHAEYLASFLNSRYAKTKLRSMCKSIIGMANINASEVKAMRIAEPPLALQQDFARRIAAVEKLKPAHRASLAQLDALFASLQHRAFRGEL
jgi:type I restriction enzyme S subunit